MIHWLTVASLPLSSPPSLLLGSSKGAGHIHPHVSWSLTGQLISASLLHPQPLPRALQRISTQYWGQHLTSSLSDFSPCVPSTQRPSFIHSFTCPFSKHRALLYSKLVPGPGHTVMSRGTQPSILDLTVCWQRRSSHQADGGGAGTGEAQPGRRGGGEIQVGRRVHGAKVHFPVCLPVWLLYARVESEGEAVTFTL